jgi:serine/threonine protein kinase
MTEPVAGESARLAGRFELVSEVHVGGMSRVFRAEDAERGGFVALKRPVRGGERELGRFQGECAILAELRHPGIVGFVAAGGAGLDGAYLATEWLAGETLGARLARGPLTLAESLAVARQAAEALAAAHRARVVHRDVKPANLMLAGQNLTLIDFGIARREVGTGLSAHVSFDGGTWAYMSPEQVMGAAELGPRADVFSLGCVLFECVSGAPAFPSDRASATIAKVWQEPPLLSARSAGVPSELVTFVRKCMSKDPSERPRDGSAVAVALAALGPLPDTQAEPRG